MLIPIEVDSVIHAAEFGSSTTLCSILLDAPAIGDLATLSVTHEGCLRLLAKKRIWGN